MKYAVIRIQGHQYKISEGQEISVDRLDGDIKPEVLLVVSDSIVKIGKPLVDGAKVALKSLGEAKGEKLHVFKYKAKSRYRKKIGFRPSLTKLLVESISIGK